MELPVKQFQTRAEQAFVDLFNAAEQGLPGARNPWVADLRAKALGAEIAGLLAYRLVIVEGELRAELSDLAGLKAAGAEVISITGALQKPPRWLKAALGKINAQDRDPVVALNLALMSGGVGLRLAKGVTLDKPVHLIHIDGGEPASVVTRNVVIVEEGASL